MEKISIQLEELNMSVCVYIDGRPAECHEDYREVIGRLGPIPVPPFDLLRLSTMGSLFITRPISLDYVRTREELTSVTDPLFTMYRTGQLKLLVNPPYALKDARKAHSDLESRGTIGKLVLSIGG
jgi:NADPH:quinone reductase-like Zn-dependent oxidoreductase